MVVPALLLLLLTLTTKGAAAAPADSSLRNRKTVWTGVYTANQAIRGRAAYAVACSRCHSEDLSAYAGLRGSKFIDNWREDDLDSLWRRISKTMPAGAPG
ncbi:MAG: cytochrome c, partial [Bryobacteraceae bacterium]